VSVGDLDKLMDKNCWINSPSDGGIFFEVPKIILEIILEIALWINLLINLKRSGQQPTLSEDRGIKIPIGHPEHR
jgi:hypothetical protein